ISADCGDSLPCNRSGFSLSEDVEFARGGGQSVAGFFGSARGFECEAEMKERKGVAFGETVGLADRDRLTKGRGARFEMLASPGGIELRESPKYNTHIVTRHAARDRALGCAPFERLLEESDRLFEVCAGLTEIRERRGEIVKDS